MIPNTSPLEYLTAFVVTLLLGALFGLYLAWSSRRTACTPCRACPLSAGDRSPAGD